MSNFLALMTDATSGPAIFRLAETMAGSQLIPPHLRGKVDDVFVALAIADQMGENPVVVMQNIYVVSGRAGWAASYMIAKANRSGVFKGRIDWRVSGKGDGLTVTAFAVLADSGQAVEMTTSMEMARDEGWTKNSKYKSMPEVMLRYRSATLLIRMYAADVMLGMHTDDELQVMPAEPVTVAQVTRPARSSVVAQIAAAADEAPITRERERVAVEVEAVSANQTAAVPQLTPGQRKAIDSAGAIGIDRATMEEKVGKSAHDWTRDDLLSLSAFVQAERARLNPATDEDGV